MSKLLDEFNVKTNKTNYNSKDYLIFKDKDLLDKFRIKVLELLSDRGFVNQNINSELINSLIDEVTKEYELSNEERMSLFNLLDDEVNGSGPLTELMNDPNVTEIMVNSPNSIYFEIDGVLKRDESISFINDEHIVRTILRLIEPVGKTIDVNSPMVDASLEDGSRINAIIPPLSKSPIITIRKFIKKLDTLDSLVGNGTLTPYMARFLKACVEAKLNIIISGSAGSGKTSLLNVLSGFIPMDERIVTIEDVRELNLKQKNVVSLETKGANYDGIGEVTIRDLVRNSLRMRPDRIIVGEVRGSEAYDMLQAMNTGHDGSLTTIHANGCKDALNRLETMVLMNNIDIPIKALREYMDSAIDIVVQVSRMRDGKRKITDISEVVGVNNNELVLRNIFEFKIDGVLDDGFLKGEFILHDYKPKVLNKIKNSGINDVTSMFVKNKKNK